MGLPRFQYPQAGEAREEQPMSSLITTDDHPSTIVGGDQQQPQPVRKRSHESAETKECTERVSPKPCGSQELEIAATCSDRGELIARIKRGESPTWIPNRHLESIWHQDIRPTSPVPDSNTTNHVPTVLPPSTDDDKRLNDGLSLERPRSALHSGDFTLDESAGGEGTKRSNYDRGQNKPVASSQPWLATSPSRPFPSLPLGIALPKLSLSSSMSSNFLYQPPTSPLVQSESNDDLDLTSPMGGIDLGSGITQNSRRHSLMMSGANFAFPSSLSPRKQQPPFRQERNFPYQAHQPRRSLTNTPNLPLPSLIPAAVATALHSSPEPASLRIRRSSVAIDHLPVHHASMVGSYEESILRGRMSTSPSKPLDFLAQIGVLGLGKCRSSLRCPAHVTLPFPAVFYSYGGPSHGQSGMVRVDDEPSPYVGQIDLENGLSNQEEAARTKRKQQSRVLNERKLVDEEWKGMEDCMSDRSARDRKSQPQKKRSSSPRAPPGGSYRIPEKGQIQIIIKNPNKTAVKLFLVPYDLAGMEPGSKTFIRQRSYSVEHIMENIPEVTDSATTTKPNRPVLRYLVHLHICCPSRGRFYLYKNARVVFANRVPDGKEKLRNEITLPEPRYTNYKPIRVMHPDSATTMASSAAAFRRRSSGFHFSGPGQGFDVVEGFAPGSTPIQHGWSHSFTTAANESLERIPWNFPMPAGGPHSRSIQEASCPAPQNLTNEAAAIESGSEKPQDAYHKLSKGDTGYGGNGALGATEGLLSQRLKSLGVRPLNQGLKPPADM